MSRLNIIRVRSIRAAVLALLTMTAAPAFGQQLLPEINAESLAPVIDRLTEVGREALRAGNAESAARAFNEILRLKPDSAEALYQLAIYHFQKQDYIRGFELIERAIENSPQNPFPRLAYGKALAEVGEFGAAIKQYQGVLDISEKGSRPEEIAIQQMTLLKFRRAVQQRDRQQVLELGRSLASSYKDNPTILQNVANVFVQAGLFEEARDTYLALQELMPNNPEIDMLLGRMYEDMRRPQQAIGYYESALEKGNGTPVAQGAQVRAGVLRGIMALQQGDPQRAHQHFLSVLELDPDNIVANMNVARYLHQQQEFEAARDILLHVLELQPENLEAHFRLALVYLDMNNPFDGVLQLDLVVARAPNSPVGQAAQRALARVAERFNLDAIRNMVAAEQTFQRQLQEDPNDAQALINLGDLRMQQRRPEEAIKFFERAIEADPGNGQAYLKAGVLYDDLREYEKAITAYQRALALIDNDKQIQQLSERLPVLSGNLLLDEREFEQAEDVFLQAYQRLRAMDEPSVSNLLPVLWGLAMSNSQQGNLEQAAEWYEELLELAPGNTGARFNAAFIYEQLEEEDKAIAHYNAIRVSDEASPRVKQQAEERLDFVRRQINGFSYVVGYSLGFDDNLNSTRQNKFFEYRSDLFASAVYRYKLDKGLKLSVAASPSYTVYHRASFDFFNFSISPNLLVEKWGYDWVMGMTRNTQSSVLRTEQSSTVTDTYNLGVSWRDEDNVGYEIGFDYRNFDSELSPFFNANTYNLNFGSNFQGPENTVLSYGYELTINDNLNSLGNDYAYTGHGVNGRIDKQFNERLTGFLAGVVNLNLYTNPDSSTSFERYRRNVNFVVSGGANYRLDSWVSLYGRYTFMTQYSNLPVGFILNELQSVEGRQSTSLGSFVRNSLNVGVRMNF